MAKAQYRKVNTLSVADKAYIAGIIDGEGTVTLTTKQKGGTEHLSVTVSNTELPLLKYLLKVIGAGRITNKRAYKAHHSLSYTYGVFNRQALDLLEQVYPYLRTYKSKRAKLVIEQYVAVTVRNGRYTSAQSKKRKRFVKKFFLILPNTKKAIPVLE